MTGFAMTVNPGGVRFLGNIVADDELEVVFRKWPVSYVKFEGDTFTDQMRAVVRMAREHKVELRMPDDPSLMSQIEHFAT
jgi:hypothetical protein